MLFFRLLRLRRRWRTFRGARCEWRMDRTATRMLALGAEPHMSTDDLLCVAWGQMPAAQRRAIELLAIVLVCLIACFTLPK